MARPVVIIFHRFGPYHCGRLRAAAKVMPVVGVEIVIMDTTYQWDIVEYTDGFRRERLFSESDGHPPSLLELRRRLFGCLARERPRAVAVPGWSATFALLALQWCLETATPAVLMSDSTRFDKPRRLMQENIKRRLVALFSSALVGGTRHVEYLCKLGFPKSLAFSGYDVVDNDHFASATEPNVGARESFLVCCRFIPVKNLTLLVESYARYRQAAGLAAWDLVLAGDGPERSKLAEAIRAHGINGSIRFVGYVQYRDLPALYRRAGAVILPSVSETWGLVVNEAMAAGLPVLVSNQCGCAADLVEEGRNGFTFDPRNADDLARLMSRVSSMTNGERAAMGHASCEIISRWTPEVFATRLVRAVEVALVVPRPKLMLRDRALLWALIHRRGGLE